MGIRNRMLSERGVSVYVEQVRRHLKQLPRIPRAAKSLMSSSINRKRSQVKQLAMDFSEERF